MSHARACDESVPLMMRKRCVHRVDADHDGNDDCSECSPMHAGTEVRFVHLVANTGSKFTKVDALIIDQEFEFVFQSVASATKK